MLFVLYNLGIFLYALFLLPKIIYDRFFLKKKRSNLLQRLGFFLPKIPITAKKIIWIHGASVGEIKAAKALLEKIREQSPTAYIIVSTTTDTGQAEAKRSCTQADLFLYFPLDLSFVVSRILKKLKPHLVLFIESDFWFNFAKAAKARGGHIGIISGKMSARSAKRFEKLKFFSKKLFAYYDFIGVQNEDYQKRFIQAGASPEKIKITGNLKYDSRVTHASQKSLDDWRDVFHLQPKDKVITLASTHEGEEEEILTSLKRIMDENNRIKLFIVPRHPERFRLIEAKLCKQRELPFGIFSKKESIPQNARLILIDTMGFLPICFQLSSLVIMGGSFSSKIGGHNILEPLFYGKPVVFGPHMHAQKEMKALVETFESGTSLSSEKLGPFILEYLKDPLISEKFERGVKSLNERLELPLEESWKEILDYL